MNLSVVTGFFYATDHLALMGYYSLFDQFMILPLSCGFFLLSPYTLVSIFILFLLVSFWLNIKSISIYFPYLLFLMQQKKPIEKILFVILLISFTFILLSNLIGFLPYATTITSQLSLTLLLAIWLIGGIFIEAITKFNLSFWQYYLPKQTTNALSWLLIPIEIISFFIRPLSLALRLFANTVCGHILMKLTGTCILSIFNWWAPASILTGPLLFLCLVTFELFIAILQAYIFVLLFSIYNEEISLFTTVFFLFLLADNLIYSLSFVYLEEYWFLTTRTLTHLQFNMKRLTFSFFVKKL